MVAATGGKTAAGPLFAVRTAGGPAPTETTLVEADGRTRFAIRSSESCIDNAYTAVDDRFAFRVARRERGVAPTGAIALGKLGEELLVVDRYDAEPLEHDPFATDSGVVTVNGAYRGRLIGWQGDDFHDLVVSDGTESTYQAIRYAQVADHFLMTAGSLSRTYARTLTGPAIDLFGQVSRPNHHNSRFATDGQFIAWGEARAADGPERYVLEKLFVAPYSNDPASYTTSRRELTVSGRVFDGSRIDVGCGYVARAAASDIDTPPAERRFGIDVFRIADGHRAYLPSVARDDWQLLEVLAVTCEDVFASVVVDDTTSAQDLTLSIARFSLASLPFQAP